MVPPAVPLMAGAVHTAGPTMYTGWVATSALLTVFLSRLRVSDLDQEKEKEGGGPARRGTPEEARRPLLTVLS